MYRNNTADGIGFAAQMSRCACGRAIVATRGERFALQRRKDTFGVGKGFAAQMSEYA